jgi:hypothetical protein
MPRCIHCGEVVTMRGMSTHHESCPHTYFGDLTYPESPKQVVLPRNERIVDHPIQQQDPPEPAGYYEQNSSKNPKTGV